jgi:hypothetical protein
MKHEIEAGLPEPLKDDELVKRLVQQSRCFGATHWQLVEAISKVFGVGLLEANHIVRRHTQGGE